MEATIKTNNAPRYIIEAWELNKAERAEFDYLDWPAIEEGTASAQFFRYRGVLYDLGEFMTTAGMPVDNPMASWDGYLADSYFSAIVVRYVDDLARVVIGLVFS